MSQASNDLPADLESLRGRLSQWREQRLHRQTPIPNQFLLEAYQLTQHHKISLVLKTLGFNHSQLKRVKPNTAGTKAIASRKNKSSVQLSQKNVPLFVDASQSLKNHEGSQTLVLSRPDGSRLTLSSPDATLLTCAFSAFLGS